MLYVYEKGNIDNNESLSKFDMGKTFLFTNVC